MSRRRLFIPPLMHLHNLMLIPIEEPIEPTLNEEVVKALSAIDKSITEITTPIRRETLTPKEYGIKKLTKKYKL